jgi:hypothetical protein
VIARHTPLHYSSFMRHHHALGPLGFISGRMDGCLKRKEWTRERGFRTGLGRSGGCTDRKEGPIRGDPGD